MSTNNRTDAPAETAKAAPVDESVPADPEASLELTDEQLSRVSGGRVKTSDKQQKAVMDFIKG